MLEADWDAMIASLPELPVVEVRHNGSTAHLAGSAFSQHRQGWEMLQAAGFTFVRRDGNGDEHWHWPGASHDVSATWYVEDNHTTVWSETAAEHFGCPIRRPMDPFGCCAFLLCGGDFARARVEAIRQGFKDAGVEAPPTVEPSTGLVVITASTVTPKLVSWLWEGWLPAAKLITLDGDPDAGKSTLCLDVAARITTGVPMPDGGSCGLGAASVVFLSGEDDLDDTTIHRLKAADANLDRVHHVQAAKTVDGERPVLLPTDLELLEHVVAATGAAMVVVDVLDEYLDDSVNSYKSAEVRKALAKMRALAGRTGAAFILIRHLRKDAAQKAIYRGTGSIGIVGAARAGLVVAPHPDDESLRVLAAVKMNLAPRPTPQTFKLIPHVNLPCAWVDWRGPLDNMTADQLLGGAGSGEPAESPEVAHCKQVLSQVLAHGREMWAEQMMEQIAEFHFTSHILNKARASLGIQTRRVNKSEFDGKVGWRVWLPHAE
jgi:hypothetical protein